MSPAKTTNAKKDGRGKATGSRFSSAEQFTSEWTERVASWVSRAVARTREEVEDIWAEAQSIRRGE
jgi:hypothetical protein